MEKKKIRKNPLQDKKKLILSGICLVLAVLLIIFLTRLVRKYTPTSEVMESSTYFGIAEEGDAAVVIDHEISQYQGKVIDDICYIDHEALRYGVNPRFFWDSQANLMIYTLPEDILEIPAESTTYTTASGQTGSEPYEIVKIDGNKTYVALDFVKKYTNMDYAYYSEPYRIVITTKWGEAQVASIRKKGKVRYEGHIKSPILRAVEKNETVDLLEAGESWSCIMTQDGYIGYIKNDRLVDQRIETRSNTFVEPVYSSMQMNDKVNLIWHAVDSMDSNYSLIYDIASVKGVNVISPTWFTISTDGGDLQSLALADYVQTAHNAGMQVWGLVENFSPDIDTTTVLWNTDSRKKIENQLIGSAIENGFDGINVDFEMIQPEAGEAYVQFMRELSVKCRKNGLVLSVDVPVPMPFNLYYDRKELGTVCDYVIIMGYDEHYVGSDAGPVASLGFEDRGIQETLQDVPAEKIVSGIPFYSRLWNTMPGEDGEDIVTSEAMGMNAAKQRLENNNAEYAWDETSGMNYAEFAGDDGSFYQMWLEDEESVEKKLELIKKYNLGGVAAWKLGLENDDIWNLIMKFV